MYFSICLTGVCSLLHVSLTGGTKIPPKMKKNLIREEGKKYLVPPAALFVQIKLHFKKTAYKFR